MERLVVGMINQIYARNRGLGTPRNNVVWVWMCSCVRFTVQTAGSWFAVWVLEYSERGDVKEVSTCKRKPQSTVSKHSKALAAHVRLK